MSEATWEDVGREIAALRAAGRHVEAATRAEGRVGEIDSRIFAVLATLDPRGEWLSEEVSSLILALRRLRAEAVALSEELWREAARLSAASS